MSVSVVVLSYDRPHLLAQALPTVLAQQPAPDEVIVVDNPGPRSDDVTRVVARHAAVRLVRPVANLGFAGGMNLGLRESRGDYVLLSEDDLLLEAGALASLRRYLEATPACALCGGIMLNHERGTVRSAGLRISLGGVFRQTVVAAGEPDPGPGGAPYAVDAVPGAGVFARRGQLLALGGFREEFFMYYEDVELCARIRRRGWTVAVVPAARLRHFEPPVAGAPPPQLEYHQMKNLVATYLLHARAAVLPEFCVRYGLVVLLRRLVRSPVGAWRHARAWLWALARMPRFMADRAALRREARP